MNEIEDSTTRGSPLSSAPPSSTRRWTGPRFQTVDMHDLLDSTLVMLAAKIGAGVTVVKDYDRTLPPIPAIRRRAQSGVDEPDRQRRRRHGPVRHSDRSHGAGRRPPCWSRSATPGPGVPEEIRSRIFEPFFTTKPFGEGTGLGLDISWRIVVNKHHGDLRVESVPGNTRFQVRLPLTQDGELDSVAEGS